LQAVEGVPKVSPEALQLRLEFLLSDKAVLQQESEPLIGEGVSPFMVERNCWDRQMRDLRRIYRAQYLQKLAEVTEEERKLEAEIHRRTIQERKRRKQAHLHRVGEDMKRRAILKDRKRIEAKVNEALEMTRRSKIKRRQIYWLRRMENMSKLIISADNLDEAMGPHTNVPTRTGDVSVSAASGALLSRNVSIPLLLRQLGGAKEFPQQRSRRMPILENTQREILESSYDLLPEDADRFEPDPPGQTASERATELYSGFSEKEKLALLDQKIQMLHRKAELDEAANKKDNITIRLLDELKAAKYAAQEGAVQKSMKEAARASRGEDPPGLPRRKTLEELAWSEENEKKGDKS